MINLRFSLCLQLVLLFQKFDSYFIKVDKKVVVIGRGSRKSKLARKEEYVREMLACLRTTLEASPEPEQRKEQQQPVGIKQNIS